MKTEHSKILFALLLAILMASALILPSCTAPNQSEQERGNSAGNIHNGGLVAGQGDWVYFLDEVYNGKIFKMRTDGSDITAVGDDISECLNVVGDWIYYINDSDGLSIYRIRTDGTDRTKICDDGCSEIDVINGWIYFSSFDDDWKIYKIRTDGSELIKINDDKSLIFFVDEEWIFYENFDDFEKYKIRTDGSERTKLSNEGSWNDKKGIDSIMISDDWLYSRWRMSTILKMEIDGDEWTSVYTDFESGLWFINVEDDWIYFSTFMTGDLYKIRTDGTNITLLSDESWIMCIHIIDDWIYYVSVNEEEISNLNRIKTDGSHKETLISNPK